MKSNFFQLLPSWLKLNVFYRSQLKNDSGEGKTYDQKYQEVHPFDANLISSKKSNGKHVLILDLDQAHWLSPSSTTGHGHLYIDADLHYYQLVEIIDVLAKHGIVQPGIKKQLKDAGFLSARPPGVVKDTNDDLDLDNFMLVAKQNPIDKPANEVVSVPVHGHWTEESIEFKEPFTVSKAKKTDTIVKTVHNENDMMFWITAFAKRHSLDMNDIKIVKNSFLSTTVWYLKVKGHRIAVIRFNADTGDTYSIIFSSFLVDNVSFITWDQIVSMEETT